MKKIEMIIRPEKLEVVKDVLDSLGVGGMTVTSVMGCGTQKGKQELYRGAALPITLLHKLKIEVVVQDKLVDSIIESIRNTTNSNTVGDGKIFVIDIEDAVRIRTGEKGTDAI